MLKTERFGDTVVWTIARPEAKNALDAATMTALLEAAVQAKGDIALRAVVLTGDGDAFVSGGDLRELKDKNGRNDAERFAEAGASLCRAFEELEVPVIAALPGVAFGGGAELAVACDLRIAEVRARISFKQARLGVTTAWGSLERLVGLVGPAAAMRLLLTAQEINAVEARTLGLVDAVCPDGTSVATARAWADDVALGSPSAVARMKRLVHRARTGGEGLRGLERGSFVATWTGEDHAEAMSAYFERRAPVWKPRG